MRRMRAPSTTRPIRTAASTAFSAAPVSGEPSPTTVPSRRKKSTTCRTILTQRAMAPTLHRPRQQEGLFLAHERLARGAVDLDVDDVARRGQPGEVHDLVVPRPPAQARGVRPRVALDEHVERAP